MERIDGGTYTDSSVLVLAQNTLNQPHPYFETSLPHAPPSHWLLAETPDYLLIELDEIFQILHFSL